MGAAPHHHRACRSSAAKQAREKWIEKKSSERHYRLLHCRDFDTNFRVYSYSLIARFHRYLGIF